MELELGLALPNQSSSSSGHVMVKGLQLDLNSSSSTTTYQNNLPRFLYQDVCSDHDHQQEVESKDLSLLLWSGQPNEQDDDPPPHKWTNLLHLNDDVQLMNDEEEMEIVGWPPINSVRKELLHRNQQQQQRVINNNIIPGRARNNNNNNNNKSMYVKVKMEGVPIGRKIDVSLYHSYQSLTHAFIHMFAKYTACKDENRDGGEYRILYQDKDGDWMLAGDVPWERFVESVRRVEIIQRKDN
ncbi:hypothetical protein ABFS83_05G145300 [Erythranthe nasuta]